MIPPSCTFSRGRLLPFRAWHLPVNVNSSPADHPLGLLITSHCKASVQSPVHHAAPSDRCSPCPPSAIGPVDPDIPARTFRWRHPSRILGNSVLDPSRIVTRLLGSPPSSQRSRAAVAHRLFTPRGQVTSLFAWAFSDVVLPLGGLFGKEATILSGAILVSVRERAFSSLKFTRSLASLSIFLVRK